MIFRKKACDRWSEHILVHLGALRNFEIRSLRRRCSRHTASNRATLRVTCTCFFPQHYSRSASFADSFCLSVSLCVFSWRVRVLCHVNRQQHGNQHKAAMLVKLVKLLAACIKNATLQKFPGLRLKPRWGLNAPPPLQYVIVHTILPPSPVILWKELGGKPKWLPLKFGYHDVMHTNPIIRMKIFFHSIVCVNFTKRPNGRNFRKLSDKVYLQTLPVFCHDHDVQKQSPFCLATANRRCEFRSRTDGLRLVPSQVEMQVYLVIMSKSFAGDRIASAIRYCYTSETI